MYLTLTSSNHPLFILHPGINHTSQPRNDNGSLGSAVRYRAQSFHSSLSTTLSTSLPLSAAPPASQSPSHGFMQFNLFNSIYSTNFSNIPFPFRLMAFKPRPLSSKSSFRSISFLVLLILGAILSDLSGIPLSVQFYTNTHNVSLHIISLTFQ